MGVFQSGQMGQTVNLLSSTSVVRIHPHPHIARQCCKCDAKVAQSIEH